YWRNARKYQARTYRHCGWDNGTVLANLLAIATALRLPAKVVCGFQDAEVNRLLDVDPQREVVFSLVALGHVSALPLQPPSEISSLGPETVPPSRLEVDYPLMREIHAASSLHTTDEAHMSGGGTPLTRFPPPTSQVAHLQRLSNPEIPHDPSEHVTLLRVSTRSPGRARIMVA